VQLKSDGVQKKFLPDKIDCNQNWQRPLDNAEYTHHIAKSFFFFRKKKYYLRLFSNVESYTMF